MKKEKEPSSKDILLNAIEVQKIYPAGVRIETTSQTRIGQLETTILSPDMFTPQELEKYFNLQLEGFANDLPYTAVQLGIPRIALAVITNSNEGEPVAISHIGLRPYFSSPKDPVARLGVYELYLDYVRPDYRRKGLASEHLRHRFQTIKDDTFKGVISQNSNVVDYNPRWPLATDDGETITRDALLRASSLENCFVSIELRDLLGYGNAVIQMAENEGFETTDRSAELVGNYTTLSPQVVADENGNQCLYIVSYIGKESRHPQNDKFPIRAITMQNIEVRGSKQELVAFQQEFLENTLLHFKHKWNENNRIYENIPPDELKDIWIKLHNFKYQSYNKLVNPHSPVSEPIEYAKMEEKIRLIIEQTASGIYDGLHAFTIDKDMRTNRLAFCYVG